MREKFTTGKLGFSGFILLLALAVTLSAVVFKPWAVPVVPSDSSGESESDLTVYSSFGMPAGTASDDGGAIAVSLPSSYKDMRLLPGGVPFGVKFQTDGLIVTGLCDVETVRGRFNPAFDAGIRVKDVIKSVGGRELSSAKELTDEIDRSAGQTVTLVCVRSGKEFTAHVTPVYSDAEGRYKTGLLLRDSGAGIGTVTFINPESLTFAGLGHGICDTDTGELVPIDRGSVMSVTIGGINRGVAGSPGEIRGYFGSLKTGTLIGNTSCGVYGILSELPSDLPEEALPLGDRGGLCEGDAYIYCTLGDDGPRKYSIRISDIDRSAKGNKCFSITVTDKALIDRTGGIIQGMSGSPIIQNGKLVGAVTHVLINDPTSGYGIFIENMIAAMPELIR